MPELAQVYLMTSNLERSRTFYESGFDLTPRREGKTSVSYETGSCELKLQADFNEELLSAFGLGKPGPERGSGSIIVLELDANLDTIYNRIADLDDELVEPLCEPQTVEWGGRMFLSRDPNGYVYEVRRTDLR